MKHAKDATLMDAVHAWTFAPKLPSHLKAGPRAYPVQLFIRDKLKTAQRFVLDNDAVELICELNDDADQLVGAHHLPKLAGWSFLARLPYDCVWFEYDNKVKIDAGARLGRSRNWNPFDPSNSTRIGYLMYREQPDTACQRWHCHVFYGADWTLPSMFSYVFDPEGDARFPVRGSSIWKRRTVSDEMNADGNTAVNKVEIRKTDRATGQMRSIWAEAEVLLGGFTPLPNDSAEWEQADWISPRLAATVDPWWYYVLGQIPFAEQRRALERDLKENTGHIRWIVSMLAAINQLPRGVKPAHPATGRRSVGMYQLPYFGHSTLTIELPRENRLIRARKLIDKEAKNSQRRWHMVIGHWRVIEHHKRTHLCRHVPTMVEDGLGMCERCALLVRWIPAHGRGDATLGVVDHSYQVTT